jgi:tetratricopeptide (TPR) repeat protein
LGKWVVILLIAGLVGVFIWLTLSLRSFDEGVDIRQQVMSGAVKTWLKHPIFGSGPGTLGEELMRHQKPLTVLWTDAHNLFLTMIAETGLLGAVGLGWLGIVCFRLVKAMLRVGDKGERYLACVACAAALLGFTAHNMVDSLFKFPLIMLMVAIVAGFWVSAALENRPPTHSTGSPLARRSPASVGDFAGQADDRRPLKNAFIVGPKSALTSKVWGYPVMAVALLVITANLITGLRSVQHIKLYNQAVEAAGQADWRTAAQGLQPAHHLAPAVPFYRQQLSFALGQLAQQEPGQRQEAITHYRAALETMDQLAVDHANLGCLLWLEGQPAEAVREMRLAKTLEPYTLLYSLNLGHYLELMGEHEAAQREYAYLLATWPEYVQSDYWFQQEGRAARLAGIIELAAQELMGRGGASLLNLIQLHLDSQNFEAARQVYDTYLNDKSLDPAVKHMARGKFLFAVEQLEAAQVEFEAVLQVDPRTAEAYLYLSRIALAKGELEKAKVYSEAALFLRESPAGLYQAGLAAEASGDAAEALKRYEAAFAQLTTLPESAAIRYATEVARRRPLPESYLPCLKTVYPTRLLAAITQAEGNLLEAQGDYESAGQLYRRLLSYEPGVQPVAAKLETLCQVRSGVCGS